MKILAYKTFKNNEEFTTWQKLQERFISSVSPVLLSGDFSNMQDVDTKFNSPEFGVFVTYFEDVED